MEHSSAIKCPVCSNNSLMAKYEAKYVYSYTIDADAPGSKNREELLPFLFDSREQKEARQYIECSVCGTQYPCFFSEGNKGVDFEIFQKSVHADEEQDQNQSYFGN